MLPFKKNSIPRDIRQLLTSLIVGIFLSGPCTILALFLFQLLRHPPVHAAQFFTLQFFASCSLGAGGVAAGYLTCLFLVYSKWRHGRIVFKPSIESYSEMSDAEVFERARQRGINLGDN